MGLSRGGRSSSSLLLWGQLLIQVIIYDVEEDDDENRCDIRMTCERLHDNSNDIRETVREGWVSEVAEGQFPYLYFWPC